MSRFARTFLACLSCLPIAAGSAPRATGPATVDAKSAGVPGLEFAIEREAEAAAFGLAAPADLWTRIDARLQLGLEAVVRSQGLDAAVRDGRLALVIADVTDQSAPRVAAINGDRMVYAASLPKIAILLGAMDKIQRGGRPSAEVEQDIQQMIRYSSNSAATRVLRWVGRDTLLALLQSPRLRLYDPQHNGGLWVGKDYGGNPAYQRDPLHQLSHGATAMQVARLFQLLEAGYLLDPERTARMKAALGDPGIRHKFVRGLESRPEARIYRKSGTWKQFHADGALVESAGRKLVLVGLAEDSQGGNWLASVAAPLYDLLLATPTVEAQKVAGRLH